MAETPPDKKYTITPPPFEDPNPTPVTWSDYEGAWKFMGYSENCRTRNDCYLDRMGISIDDEDYSSDRFAQKFKMTRRMSGDCKPEQEEEQLWGWAFITDTHLSLNDRTTTGEEPGWFMKFLKTVRYNAIKPEDKDSL